MLATVLFLAAAVQQPNCADPDTQTDMTLCAGRDYKAADAALNAQWKITYAKMKAWDAEGLSNDGRPGHAPVLLDGQRAWLKYRDAHCVSEGYYARGGSMEPMLVSRCLAELTKKRTEQLRELAESN